MAHQIHTTAGTANRYCRDTTKLGRIDNAVGVCGTKAEAADVQQEY